MMTGLALAFCTLIMNVIAHFFISASSGENRNYLYVASGLVFYALGFIFWVFALSRVSVTLAYPILALGIIIIPAIERYMAGEELTLATLMILIWILAGFLALILNTRTLT